MSSHGHIFAILLSSRILNAVRNGVAKAEVSVPLSSSYNVVPHLRWCLSRSTLRPKSLGILAMTGPMSYLISLRVDELILNPSPLRHKGKFCDLTWRDYRKCLYMFFFKIAFTTDEHFLMSTTIIFVTTDWTPLIGRTHCIVYHHTTHSHRILWHISYPRPGLPQFFYHVFFSRMP